MPPTITWRHIPLFMGVMLLTYLIHEAGHWGMGKLLGYDMWVNLNSAGLIDGEYTSNWHSILVGAAGPIVTIFQAILAYVILRKRTSIAAFAFIFSAFVMRLTAMGISFFNPNDEAAISLTMGIGKWTLPLLVVVGLLFLLIKASPYVKPGWRGYVIGYIGITIMITAVVMGEPYVPRLEI